VLEACGDMTLEVHIQFTNQGALEKRRGALKERRELTPRLP
jgi:hypothetical protein